MKKIVVGLVLGLCVALVSVCVAGTFENTTVQHEGATGLKDLCRLIDANFDAVSTASSADGDFQIASNLVVGGTSSLTGAVTVVGNETVGGWLKVTGAVTGANVVASSAVTAGTGVSGVWGNFSGAVTAATGVASAAGVSAGTGVSGVWGNYSGAVTGLTFTASTATLETNLLLTSIVKLDGTSFVYVTKEIITRGGTVSSIGSALTTNTVALF